MVLEVSVGTIKRDLEGITETQKCWGDRERKLKNEMDDYIPIVFHGNS